MNEMMALFGIGVGAGGLVALMYWAAWQENKKEPILDQRRPPEASDASPARPFTRPDSPPAIEL